MSEQRARYSVDDGQTWREGDPNTLIHVEKGQQIIWEPHRVMSLPPGEAFDVLFAPMTEEDLEAIRERAEGLAEWCSLPAYPTGEMLRSAKNMEHLRAQDIPRLLAEVERLRAADGEKPWWASSVDRIHMELGLDIFWEPVALSLTAEDLAAIRAVAERIIESLDRVDDVRMRYGSAGRLVRVLPRLLAEIKRMDRRYHDVHVGEGVPCDAPCRVCEAAALPKSEALRYTTRSG